MPNAPAITAQVTAFSLWSNAQAARRLTGQAAGTPDPIQRAFAIRRAADCIETLRQIGQHAAQPSIRDRAQVLSLTLDHQLTEVPQ
jgi:hypothetical protein